jgi:hypothetical protein
MKIMHKRKNENCNIRNAQCFPKQRAEKEEMGDIPKLGDADDAKAIIYKCAELFKFPAHQFYLSAQGDSKLKEAILEHDISFYEDAVNRINAMSNELDKMCERAKLQKILGKSSEELQRLSEHMTDMYCK